VNGSKLVDVALILAAALVPDAVAIAVLVPAPWWPLKLLLVVLDLYALGWFLGIYGTMIRRPHELGERVRLFNGVLAGVEFDRANVSAAVNHGVRRRRALPKRADAAYLTWGGVPVVEIGLAQPALLRTAYRGERYVRTVFVASDAPEQLVAALTA